VTCLLEIGPNDAARVFVRFLAGLPDLLGDPEAEELVATRKRLEPQFLIVGKFALEGVFPFVKCGHDCVPFP
jgi:hypothetical protein